MERGRGDARRWRWFAWIMPVAAAAHGSALVDEAALIAPPPRQVLPQ
jgi:hypothetical protein